MQVGNFCTSVFPWILSQKTLYIYISLVAICLKWNASPSLKTAKSRMMKHNPNIVITWYTRLCILYIVQVFTLNFTKMLLITFTRTYRLIRKEINRVWSILKTIVTGKRCSMDPCCERQRHKVYLQGGQIQRYRGHWVQKDLLVASSKKETPFLSPSLGCFKPFLSTPAFL